MIFPIGDDNIKGGYKPVVSYGLILMNLLIFLYQVTLAPAECGLFLQTYGSIPVEITSGEDLYTLLSSMFLHGGWMHFLGNMLFLWVFADNIEAIIGSIPFLVFYIVGGLAASALHIAFNLNSAIPSVGASGAISAVMGTYLVMFPKSRIKVLVVFLFNAFYMSALFFLGLWFIQQLLAGVGSIGITAEGAGVAWWAHIGGFVYGIVFGFLFKNVYADRYTYGKENIAV